QADALYGELAMIGRLNRHTFAEPFAVCVPNALYPAYADLDRCVGVPDFLAREFPPDTRLCLLSGGFNTWTDVDLLIEGLAGAMEQAPGVVFVSAGGAVHGHDESTYGRFLRQAAARLPGGRWKALGWTAFPHVLSLHAAARVGLNIDGE